MKRTLLYFRKDLRLQDNPALLKCISIKSEEIFPIFILDPHYIMTARCGINRWRFLLESLENLDQNLRKHGSRLLVLRGDPMQVLPLIYKHWQITHLVHTVDTEPFWQMRDSNIQEFSQAYNVQVLSVHGHTLFDPIQVTRAYGGTPPLQMRSFDKAIRSLPKPPKPILSIPKLPPVSNVEIGNVQDFPIDQFTRPTFDVINKQQREKLFSVIAGPAKDFSVPTLSELGFKDPNTCPHKGGEDEANRLLNEFFKDKKRAASFEKPKTSPAAFDPASTTILSPHLKFGTLSCRVFYHELMNIYSEMKHSEPPVSLLGQLYWREFYYASAAVVPNYHKMIGNPVCLQVDWWLQDPKEDNQKAQNNLKAWSLGQTGFPWIDAIMRQLRREGWIHHLARHSVACFLTRGDLFISWERGAEVFEEFLLDHDSALNIGNWLWLSASAYFTSYFRVYSPIAFAKQWDPKGEYIKRYVPEVKDLPLKYIYEPWTAPLSVQKQANCIIGTDYPHPIVDHKTASQESIEKMGKAYKNGQKGLVDEKPFVGPMGREFLGNWNKSKASIPKKRHVE